MGNRTNTSIHRIKWILVVLLTGVLLFLVLAECLLPAENVSGSEGCRVFESSWERILSDGTRVAVTVPGECEAERKEAVVVETVLPENLTDETSLCFRSSMQDMEIYVDGELRQNYTTKDTRPFGRNSVGCYVFAKLNSSDRGKTLRLVTITDSWYTGLMNQVYIGDKSDIQTYLVRVYGGETLVAACMLFLSITCVAVGIILRYLLHKNIALHYLGGGIMLTTLWILSESKLRQFFFPNVSVVANMAVFFLMLLPLPLLLYMNHIQAYRYQKWYVLLCVANIVDFVISTGLQLLEIYDFVDTIFITYVILLIEILFVSVTIVIDWYKKIGEYRLIAVGVFGMIVSGIVEMIWQYQRFIKTTGIMMNIGLFILIIMAFIQTGREIIGLEKEKQLAVMMSKSKADFLASMSHEIRTPINTIMGMNEMILRENKDETIDEYAQSIGRAGDMLLALINDVLDFSKIEAGKLELVEANYNVADLLKDVSMVLQMKAEKKGLQAQVKIDGEIPRTLYGDEVRIKQILNNLLTNAVKYTPSGSVLLEVNGKREKEGPFCLVMAVEDTGMGIREEDRKRLFESFTRLEENRNRSIEGTGLGLNITKRLVELMHGSIDVQSVYGKGSRFTVELPQGIVYGEEEELAKEASQIETTIAKGRLQRDSVLPDTGTQLYAPEATVLAVDDNEMNLVVFRALLKRTGIQVETASGGQECLECCRTKKYDLIFLDHMMPEPDGIETLHMLRREKDGFNAQTEVIALTANAVSGSRENYLKEGFTDYLSKPINVEALEQILDRYLPAERKEREVHLSKDKAIQYCYGNEEMYAEVLKAYWEQGQEYLSRLPEFFQQGDWKNYAIIVHAIKSTSLQIGAEELSEMAFQQEMAAKEEKEAFLKENWEGFFQLYNAVLKKIEGML